MAEEADTSQAAKSCKHTRTRVIAKDNDAQYLECLDCGAILEAGEFKENSASGESLSDA
jgi:transcription initiation factor TFIIIB Brf1 subunit/transcription initiation factor TFIIB